MPDFFKKMKRKVDKKKMTGDKMSSKERPPRRLKFLPLQASTTSIFCRRKTGASTESDGDPSKNKISTSLIFSSPSLYIQDLKLLNCSVKCVLFFFFFTVEVKPKKRPSKKNRRNQNKTPLTRKQRIRQQIREKMLRVKAAVIEV